MDNNRESLPDYLLNSLHDSSVAQNISVIFELGIFKTCIFMFFFHVFFIFLQA